jgi:hypothetical protein
VSSPGAGWNPPTGQNSIRKKQVGSEENTKLINKIVYLSIYY